MTVAEFKKKHADHLDLLIDPNHPDFGPVNNQFVVQAGRIEHGRKEFGKRFAGPSFGSVNFFEHTSICEQSHHIAFKEVTRNYKTGGKEGTPEAGHLECRVRHVLRHRRVRSELRPTKPGRKGDR